MTTNMQAAETAEEAQNELTDVQRLLIAGVSPSDIILKPADIIARLRLGRTAGLAKVRELTAVQIAPERWRLADIHAHEPASAAKALRELGLEQASESASVPDPRRGGRRAS